MGIRLAIASIPKEDEVQKVLKIQIATLLCILLNSLERYI